MRDAERPPARPRGSFLEHTGTYRIQALVDGVFAIVMTLLVFTIDIPDVAGPASDATVLIMLGGLLPQLGVYGITFVLLGLLWYNNRRYFAHIARGDGALQIMTLVWLMLVALVPFTTLLNSRYLGLRLPAMLFHLNMLLIGVLLRLTWVHVSGKGLLREEMDSAARAAFGRSSWAFPVIPALAVVASLITPLWSSALYLTIPLARWALGRAGGRAAANVE